MTHPPRQPAGEPPATRALDPSEQALHEIKGAGGLVAVTTSGLFAPSLCACCLEPAGDPARLEARGGPTIVVQYCSACRAHAAAEHTHELAVLFASGLLGLATAAALVLTWGTLRPALQAMLAAATALLPAVALLRPRATAPHTTRGAAVWWRDHGAGRWTLVCTHPGFAKLLATSNGARWSVTRTRPLRWPWSITAPLLLALGAVPLAHGLFGVDVRILNRQSIPAVILVDGRHRGVVSPSLAESPAAGTTLRLVAGRRHLLLVGEDGQVLVDSPLALRPGADYLVAVSAEPVCFWIEQSVYGRAQADAPARQLLVGPGPVWALPGTIDTWFAPNPPSSGNDTVSSGGTLLALRQGRCP